MPKYTYTYFEVRISKGWGDSLEVASKVALGIVRNTRARTWESSDVWDTVYRPHLNSSDKMHFTVRRKRLKK